MKKTFPQHLSLFLAASTIFPIILGLCMPRLPQGTTSPQAPAESGVPTTVFSLNTATRTVKEYILEEYLVGVLAAEMPASYELEALKAQAVAARSYILSKSGTSNPDHPDAQICTDSTHCKGWLSEEEAKSRWKLLEREKYWNKLQSAVKSTAGQYMTHEDRVIEAFFFASDGGRTENSEDVWSSPRPYLKSVESCDIAQNSDIISTARFSLTDFNSRLQPHFAEALQSTAIPQITNLSRTDGGSVSRIDINGKTFKGTEIRSIFGLKSANFTVSADSNGVVFTVSGSGHGVGMSQLGANQMAKEGQKYTEILSHYYTNIQITEL